jgi:NAD(P)-dependent dehydrogenase (short-subunit alcohol dehydrogenase family)
MSPYASSAKHWNADSIPSQAGRRAIVTGANSGIGFYTALELARHGAEVVIASRSIEKAQDAAQRIITEVPTAKLIPAVLDLASQGSIRAFAAQFAEAPLDLLINNAGVMALPTRELTVDGWERQFATNYLGPFTLTALLMPTILRTPNSRIVTVASTAANYGKIRFDNLQSQHRYKPMFGAYAQSKLADLIFAIELQRRLTSMCSSTVSVAAHPGYSVTNLQAPHLSAGLKLITALLKPLLSQDALHGALPTLFAAVSPDARPGGYYGPDGFQEMKGYPAPAKIPELAQDHSLAHRLWDATENITGITFNLRG